MNEKEVTIQELLAQIYLFFKRYFLIILVFGVIGLAVGIYKKKHSRPYYQSYIYVATGIIYNPRSADYNINLLEADLKTLATHINDRQWVKENFNLDTSSFKSMSVSLEKYVFTRVFYPVKITLKAYSKQDFERFKRGLKYYYEHRSPLLRLYKKQQELIDTLRNVNYFALYEQFLKQYNGTIIFSPSNIYDEFSKIQYSYILPLMYFASDFAQFKYVKNTNQIISIIVIFITFGLIVSFGIDLLRRLHLYIKNRK